MPIDLNGLWSLRYRLLDQQYGRSQHLLHVPFPSPWCLTCRHPAAPYKQPTGTKDSSLLCSAVDPLVILLPSPSSQRLSAYLLFDQDAIATATSTGTKKEDEQQPLVHESTKQLFIPQARTTTCRRIGRCYPRILEVLCNELH